MNSEKAQHLIQTIDASIDALAQNTDALRQTEDWKHILRTISSFHTYSLYNQLAIWSQRPDATRVAGYETWKKLGRQVNRGAKGISILAPIMYKKAADKNVDGMTEIAHLVELDGVPSHAGKMISGFRTVHVFDVSNTEGADLPKLKHEYAVHDFGLLPLLEAAVKCFGVELIYKETSSEALMGYSTGGKIVVRPNLPAGETCSIIAHELAHELLHQCENRQEANALGKKVREIEAESCSYAVMQHFGIQTDASVYLATYGADAVSIKSSLGRVRTTVGKMLDAIAKAEPADALIAA